MYIYGVTSKKMYLYIHLHLYMYIHGVTLYELSPEPPRINRIYLSIYISVNLSVSVYPSIYRFRSISG